VTQDFQWRGPPEQLPPPSKIPVHHRNFSRVLDQREFRLWYRSMPKDVASWEYCGTRAKPMLAQSKRASQGRADAPTETALRTSRFAAGCAGGERLVRVVRPGPRTANDADFAALFRKLLPAIYWRSTCRHEEVGQAHQAETGARRALAPTGRLEKSTNRRTGYVLFGIGLGRDCIHHTSRAVITDDSSTCTKCARRIRREERSACV